MFIITLKLFNFYNNPQKSFTIFVVKEKNNFIYFERNRLLNSFFYNNIPAFFTLNKLTKIFCN